MILSNYSADELKGIHPGKANFSYYISQNNKSAIPLAQCRVQACISHSLYLSNGGWERSSRERWSFPRVQAKNEFLSTHTSRKGKIRHGERSCTTAQALAGGVIHHFLLASHWSKSNGPTWSLAGRKHLSTTCPEWTAFFQPQWSFPCFQMLCLKSFGGK